MKIERTEAPKSAGFELPADGVFGKVSAVRRSGRGCEFREGEDLPALYDVLIGQSFNKRKVVLEVAEHLSKNDVRCISLSEP